MTFDIFSKLSLVSQVKNGSDSENRIIFRYGENRVTHDHRRHDRLIVTRLEYLSSAHLAEINAFPDGTSRLRVFPS